MILTRGLFAMLGPSVAGGDLVVPVPLAALAVAVLAGAFFLWCLLNPALGRTVARIFAVVAIGLGCGLLTWGLCSGEIGDPGRVSLFATLALEPVDAIGLGSGFLASGLTALFLTFVSGGRRVRRQPVECRSSAGRVGLRSPELDQELWLG